MSYFEEYSLLIAVLTPVLMLAAMNAVLALMGERGTLLLPVVSRYPRLLGVDEQAGISAATVVNDARQALPPETYEALTRDACPANSHALAEAMDAA